MLLSLLRHSFGLVGPTRFTLCRVETSTGSSGLARGSSAAELGRAQLLPTASACFNLLKLPAYARFEVLEQKLLTAIRHGAEGFVFS